MAWRCNTPQTPLSQSGSVAHLLPVLDLIFPTILVIIFHPYSILLFARCALSPFVVLHQIQLFAISLYSGVRLCGRNHRQSPLGRASGARAQIGNASHDVKVPSLGRMDIVMAVCEVVRLGANCIPRTPGRWQFSPPEANYTGGSLGLAGKCTRSNQGVSGGGATGK
jgi:hypothetical protein